MPSGIEVEGLQVSYNGTAVLRDIGLRIGAGMVTAIIGPSGCGKSTLLRCLNRLSETAPNCRVAGEIRLDGDSIYSLDTMLLRRRVGMVFQKPNPFPMSVRENVLYGVKATRLRVGHGEVVRSCLQQVALWDEVKDRLDESALHLSVGQQQRLCIARSLAVAPEVVLMDEPAASLDPTSAAKLEATISGMRGQYTIVIVTHNMQQARRVSDHTAFIYLGEVVEAGETERLFRAPERQQTRAYITGQFG